MEAQPISLSTRRPPAAPGAAGQRTLLRVQGMTCGNCARHVAEALQAVAGARSASVSLENGTASILWHSHASPSPAALIQAVRQAGFEAEVEPPCATDATGGRVKRRRGWQMNLWVGALGTLPLMLGEWVFHLGMTPWFEGLSFVLATIVQGVGGGPFYRGAWRQLKARSANMDTLVALGSSTAYLYSVWALFGARIGHLYFMEAAAIITLISAGHWMEARASAHAAAALRKLMALAPALARRVGLDGRETEIPLAGLRMGDRVLLKPGDRVPVDGKVIEGSSAVDESMLTGEAMPVEKAPGALAYAGTINLNGRLVLHVTATGETTALARIIEAVQRAQNSRASIQRLGDRVSSVFVPIVVLIALGTAGWWGWHSGLGEAVVHAAAVLIVACPCAMGLATPIAIMAGTNAAAQRGILIRDGIALEKAGTITSVIFDKTGTLTQGKPAVVATQTFKSESAVDGIQLAVALARPSNHPLSRAIVLGASEAKPMAPGESPMAQRDRPAGPLQNWQEVRGAGVLATLHLPAAAAESASKPALARLGSPTWLRSQGVNFATGDPFLGQWSREGATVLGVALNRDLLGVIALHDTLKPQAVAVVRELRTQGYTIYLATGDNNLTATTIAAQLNIRPANVRAQVRPEEKAEWVGLLQTQGHRVAFIGDGINDAPALQRANLGIAVCAASDIANESADLVLLKSDIHAIPEALQLAQFTLRIIKQNLFWAFFYNAAAIPLAATGLLSPVFCAAAMGLSDLMVIGNALRLLRARTGGPQKTGPGW